MKGIMMSMANVPEEMTFELIPEGQYKFEVEVKKDSETKNGDPMVNITLGVVGGECEGKRVWDNIILSTNPESPGYKVRWRAKMFLKSIGKEHKGDSFEWDSDDWIMERCLGEVKHEIQKEGKYAGQKKAVISKYLPLKEEKDGDIPF